MIHGLLHFESVHTMRWRTQRILYDGAYARVEHRTYTNADLQRIGSEISEFGADLSPKVWAIIGGDPRLIAPEKLEQAGRELGMTQPSIILPVN